MDGVVVLPISGQSHHPQSGGGASVGEGIGLRDLWLGPENRLVSVAIETVLQDRSSRMGPVVFYGPCGAGKTHLATGLVAAYRARCRPRSAVYVTAVDFNRELADAIETQTTDEFRRRYRQASLLAVDDVDRLAGKEASQQELVYTLDAVLEDGGQAVFTSSAAVGQLTGFLPSLQSRLVQGLTVPLALPSPETRLAVLKRLAEQRGIPLGSQTAETLALGLKSSIAGLAGVLGTLQAACAPGQAITMALVRDYLAGHRTPAGPSLRDIAATVARHFSLRLADLRSPSRRRGIVAARDVAMYLARALTGESLQRIGSYFNGRDHTTVSHGCSKTESLLRSDGALRAAVDQIRASLEPAWR